MKLTLSSLKTTSLLSVELFFSHVCSVTTLKEKLIASVAEEEATVPNNKMTVEGHSYRHISQSSCKELCNYPFDFQGSALIS